MTPEEFPIDLSIQPLRIAEAKKLTEAMFSTRPFSYLRLGDGEVNWMLRMMGDQNACRLRYQYASDVKDISHAHSVTGLEGKYFDRLVNAYSNCSYLDLYNRRSLIQSKLEELPIKSHVRQLRNSSPETSIIFFEWTYFEMIRYLKEKTCLIAGAEAPLLKELYRQPRYRELSSRFFSESKDLHFLGIRESGRNYSENLDLIKEDLRKYIVNNKIDTLFLSLATGAKIICYELAEELGICTFDFGSMTRGLTYSATPGYHTYRSNHNPFFFYIPLDLYMDALEAAFPETPLEEKIVKAQAQLVLNLQKKEVMNSFASDTANSANLTLTEENLNKFYQDYQEYKKRFRKVIHSNLKCKELDAKFKHWQLHKGIGIKGKLFLASVRTKSKLRNLILNLNQHRTS